MQDNLAYYRRRAAEEMSAAERAPNAVIAAVHRSMAERYLALSGELHPNAIPQKAAD